MSSPKNLSVKPAIGRANKEFYLTHFYYDVGAIGKYRPGE